jgi:hypothetical protein
LDVSVTSETRPAFINLTSLAGLSAYSLVKARVVFKYQGKGIAGLKGV